MTLIPYKGPKHVRSHLFPGSDVKQLIKSACACVCVFGGDVG